MNMKGEGKILVSACLAGFECRYDGKSNTEPDIVRLVRDGKALPVCPEQLGGLMTPRSPAEVKTKNGLAGVYNAEGIDVTEWFKKGALKTLKIAKFYDIRTAILKSKSPSCGVGRIYSGDFSRRLVCGDGITAKLLKDNGINVISDDEYKKEKESV